MFCILSDNQVINDVSLLSKAWGSPDSFIVLPSLQSVSSTWLETVVGQLPAFLKQGHFGILTSGSTGIPKLVFGNKDNAIAMVEQIHHRQDLELVQCTISALPLSYCYSLVNQWLWSYAKNRSLFLTSGLAHPASFFEALDMYDHSMICLVGSQVSLLKNYLEKGRSFERVARLNFAGGLFPQEHLNWLEATFPSASIIHNYGCTEALPRLTIRKGRDCIDPLVLGAPLQGIEFKIDPSGHLLFRSPYAAIAISDEQSVHLQKPEEWLNTGDKAERLHNGELRLLGRWTEVFKRYGEKVSLGVLGASLRKIWSGELIFYLEQEPEGELSHILVICPFPDSNQLAKILLHLRENFRRPIWPLRIESVQKIPLTENGKTDHAAIRDCLKQILWKQRL